MNDIKKAINQIPLPKQLSKVTQSSLNHIPQKSKKGRWILPTVATLFLTIFTSSFVLSNYISIPEFFQTKEKRLAQIDPSVIVVESDKFSISLKQFIDYKENTLLIHEVNNYPYTLTDLDVLNRMIENELLLAEAKKAGITVTSEEVETHISEVQSALEVTNDPILNELTDQLAKALNVSVDDYYEHPETIAKYEAVVMTNKFVEKLYVDGVLNDQYNIEQYKVDLRMSHKSNLYIFENELIPH